MSDVKEWLAQYVPEAVTTLVVAAVGFLGRRELKRIDQAHATNAEQIGKHDTRLGALERSTVTRADFDELRGSLTASIVNVGERLERRIDTQTTLRDDQTNLILRHLLEMKAQK